MLENVGHPAIAGAPEAMAVRLIRDPHSGTSTGRTSTWVGGRALVAPFGRLGKWLRGWVLVPIATAAVALTLAGVLRVRHEARLIEVTIATGGNRGLRARLLESLEREPNADRLRIHGKMIAAQEKMFQELEAGQIQFALIQGGFDLSRYPDLRLGAALHVEPLHLLVKEELVEDVTRSLRALKGKRIQLGSGLKTVGHRLAVEIMASAGLKARSPSGQGDYQSEQHVNIIEEHDRDRLPDTVFIVSALPSSTVRHLVSEQRFRLVALPFARAFSLGSLTDLGESPAAEGANSLLRDRVVATTIPAYTYSLDPAVPATDIPTFGTRVVLITHRAVSTETVERLLDAINANRFARAFQPPLTRSMLGGAQEAPWHPGTVRFMERDKPVFTSALIGNLANSIQIIVPSLGALLCLWQWYRRRARTRHERTFEAYMLKIAHIESEALALELTDGHDPPAALRLRHELGRLKTEALRLFCQGELVGNDLMANFLIQINDTRSFLSALIVRRRDEYGNEAPCAGASHAHAMSDKGSHSC